MAIDISSFSGSLTLQATTGCTLSGNATFTAINLERNDKDALIGTFGFVSDGSWDITWDETGSGPTVIEGDNANVTTPSGFNIHANAWTANIEVDQITWTTFDSRWKNNKPGNAVVVGTIVGVVEFDSANTQPVPSV